MKCYKSEDSEQSEDSGQTSPPTRILVADDQPAMLVLMDRALGASYECEFASTVEEAREHLDTGSYQLAICNLDAGGQSRLGLAGEIVEEYPLTATIVLVTGEDDPEAARLAFAHGVYGYLVEPFWPGQLLTSVMSALRRRELEIAARAHDQNLEDRRQTIIDMAPIGIYAKDLSGHYVVANCKADQLAGMEPGELVGETDQAFLSGEEFEVGVASFARVLDEEGEIDAVGGISIDITAERETARLRGELAATQQEAIDALRLSRQETIEGLAKAINLHDVSTGEHGDRMAAVAAFLAERLGFDPDRALLIRAAAPMHDVGKIGIPAELLCKPGPLSAEERREMERHSVVGHEVFAQFESDLCRTAATIALTHHECFDGSGYPQGLAGEGIPLEGRITAVADVFDALLSDRSYRSAMPVEEAVEVMRAGRGSHFDPKIVDALLDNLDEALAVRG